MWFIGVDEQEMSAPPPKKNPGSAPEAEDNYHTGCRNVSHYQQQQRSRSTYFLFYLLVSSFVSVLSRLN